MISKSQKKRRIIQEDIKHSVDCPWWGDWHTCNCGEFDKQNEEWDLEKEKLEKKKDID